MESSYNMQIRQLRQRIEELEKENKQLKEANSLLTISNYESDSTLAKPVLKEESHKNIKIVTEGFSFLRSDSFRK